MKPYYYIHRVGYGKPTIKHATLEEAVNESLRLAGQQPDEPPNNRPQDGRVCQCEDAPSCGHYEL